MKDYEKNWNTDADCTVGGKIVHGQKKLSKAFQKSKPKNDPQDVRSKRLAKLERNWGEK